MRAVSGLVRKVIRLSPLLVPSLHTFYISVSIQSRTSIPYRIRLDKNETRDHELLPSLFDKECSPLLPVVTIRTQAKELKTTTQAPLKN